MASTIHDPGIDRMDLDARIAPAEGIRESVGLDVENSPPPESQRRELEKRLAGSLERPHAVTPCETVKARALARATR